MQRRAGWALLAAVTLAHVLAANELATDRFGWGADSHKPMARIDVAFVRELAQAQPAERAPVAAAAPATPAARAALPAVAPAASAAALDAAPAAATALPPTPMPLTEPAPTSVPELPAAVQADNPMPTAPTPAATASSATTTAAVVPSVPAAASAVSTLPKVANFDWPPSTRLTYNLTGDYRGPVQGNAKVEWLRSGTHYQVQLEANAALIFTRRTTSEGELTERGLAPQRFEAEQKALFNTVRWRQQFLPDRVVLANGSEVPMQLGGQDEASQFVQLTWLFTTQPHLLQVGRSIEVPLAVKSRFDRWTYEVTEQQTLHLPFGDVDTFHVQSRRDAKGSDLIPEIWIAPSLQYLPVRILLRQSGSTSFVDLQLSKPPLQADR